MALVRNRRRRKRKVRKRGRKKRWRMRRESIKSRLPAGVRKVDSADSSVFDKMPNENMAQSLKIHTIKMMSSNVLLKSLTIEEKNS